MAAKKITSKKTVPVVKHKLIRVQQLGTRTRRELEAEFNEAIEKGYKVYAFGRKDGAVEIQMGLTEEWSVEDFMTELDELLGDGR